MHLRSIRLQSAASSKEPPDDAPRSNCGGGCIKMGQGGFARLLKADPCAFAEWEENEERMREQLGDVAILRDRRGGTTTPLTLRALRQRIEREEPVDMFDIGGCGCFVEGAPTNSQPASTPARAAPGEENERP